MITKLYTGRIPCHALPLDVSKLEASGTSQNFLEISRCLKDENLAEAE